MISTLSNLNCQSLKKGKVGPIWWWLCACGEEEPGGPGARDDCLLLLFLYFIVNLLFPSGCLFRLYFYLFHSHFLPTEYIFIFRLPSFPGFYFCPHFDLFLLRRCYSFSSVDAPFLAFFQYCSSCKIFLAIKISFVFSLYLIRFS